MSEGRRRGRRLLLAGLGLGGLAVLVTPVLVRSRIKQRVGPDCAEADWVFRNSESAREVGRRYLAQTPEALQALRSELTESLQADPDSVGRDLLSAQITSAIETDFESGRVVYVDGWMLSETEARLCASRLLR